MKYKSLRENKTHLPKFKSSAGGAFPLIVILASWIARESLLFDSLSPLPLIALVEEKLEIRNAIRSSRQMAYLFRRERRALRASCIETGSSFFGAFFAAVALDSSLLLSLPTPIPYKTKLDNYNRVGRNLNIIPLFDLINCFENY
jgi:hypothetical protein